MNEIIEMVIDYLKIAGVIQLSFGLGVNIINMFFSMVFGHEKVKY